MVVLNVKNGSSVSPKTAQKIMKLGSVVWTVLTAEEFLPEFQFVLLRIM